jgi:hypothetical protein
MNWTTLEGTHLSSPYTIRREIRGFSVWFKKGDRFGVLGRELHSIELAKAFAETHRAKEEYQAKQLDAVFVK